MPEYQSLSDPSQLHNERTNPYITKRFKKGKTLIVKRRSRNATADGEMGDPLLRDLLIMKDGIKSIMGYDQLAPEEATSSPGGDIGGIQADQGLETESGDIVGDIGGIEGKDSIDPTINDKPTPDINDPNNPRNSPYTPDRGYDRDDPINPEELELLRLILLLITKGT